jgi:hypothetical protein
MTLTSAAIPWAGRARESHPHDQRWHDHQSRWWRRLGQPVLPQHRRWLPHCGGFAVGGGDSGQPDRVHSVNDNSVGGPTGTGDPTAGDWTGIESSGNTEIEQAKIAYASTALDLEASPGVNDAIHSDWFDENQTALGGSSDWDGVDTGVEACQYVPQISSTGNTYGTGQATTPFVSQADYDTITAAILAGAETSPEDWPSYVAVGSMDTITWTTLPCTDGETVTSDLATPYGFFSG